MASVRKASEADVELILELIDPFVQAELLLQRNADEIARLTTRGFVAVDKAQPDKAQPDVERLIGFASVEVYSQKLGEIQCLAVHRDYQHKGVGKMLVDACIQLARDEQILELMAISASDNFLKRCGFDYSLPNQKRALFYRFDQE